MRIPIVHRYRYSIVFLLSAAAILISPEFSPVGAAGRHSYAAAAGDKISTESSRQDTGLRDLKIGDTAPEIRLPDIFTGKAVAVDFTGRAGRKNAKPALILFWYLACPNCIADMRHIKRIGETYAGSIEIITVNVDPPSLREPAGNFIKNNKMTGCLNLAETIYETDDQRFYLTADRYGVVSTPSVFLIARDGTVAYRAEKDISFDELEKRIDTVTKSK